MVVGSALCLISLSANNASAQWRSEEGAGGTGEGGGGGGGGSQGVTAPTRG